jgi:uncharacterized membrane protein YcaP (DUF421 family)
MLDWQRAFAFDTPPLEIALRGTVVYLGLFFLLRVVLKRQSGTTGITDLLVIVLLADASQNAMSANYASISDGMVLVVTIVAWSYALDYAAFRFPRVAKVIHPKPLPLVKDGVLLRRNMRRELITEDDLRAQLRQQGIEDVDRVKAVYMEGDGHFSIVTGQHRPLTGKERQRL